MNDVIKDYISAFKEGHRIQFLPLLAVTLFTLEAFFNWGGPRVAAAYVVALTATAYGTHMYIIAMRTVAKAKVLMQTSFAETLKSDADYRLETRAMVDELQELADQRVAAHKENYVKRLQFHHSASLARIDVIKHQDEKLNSLFEIITHVLEYKGPVPPDVRARLMVKMVTARKQHEINQGIVNKATELDPILESPDPVFEETMNTKTHVLPTIGTVICIEHNGIHRPVTSNDQPGTPMCRIQLDDNGHWQMLPPTAEKGLIVFLNDMPAEDHNVITVTRIVSTGKAVYADSSQ